MGIQNCSNTCTIASTHISPKSSEAREQSHARSPLPVFPGLSIQPRRIIHSSPPRNPSIPSTTLPNSVIGTSIICPLVSTPNESAGLSSPFCGLLLKANVCEWTADCAAFERWSAVIGGERGEKRARESRARWETKNKTTHPPNELVLGVVHPKLLLYPLRAARVRLLGLLARLLDSLVLSLVESGIGVLLKV
jgi:hypothetical protein